MISEKDIADWIPTEQPVKLYEVSRGTLITLPTVEDVFFWFHHVDGMYSYNTIVNGEHKGEVEHIAAFTEVIPWKKKETK